MKSYQDVILVSQKEQVKILPQYWINNMENQSHIHLYLKTYWGAWCINMAVVFIVQKKKTDWKVVNQWRVCGQPLFFLWCVFFLFFYFTTLNLNDVVSSLLWIPYYFQVWNHILHILLNKKEQFFNMNISHFGNTLHLETLSSGFPEVPIVGLSWPQHALLLQRCESWGSWQIRDCQAGMCSSRETDSCLQHHPEGMTCQITSTLGVHERYLGYHDSYFLLFFSKLFFTGREESSYFILFLMKDE